MNKNYTLNFRNAKYEVHTYPINGKISNAIKAYETNGVPLRQLLSDLDDVTTHPEDLKMAVNAWEYLHLEIKNTPVVCGVTASESLFNVAAMSLAKQSPLKVIKSIFYRNKARDDSGLEKLFLGAIQNLINQHERILLLNPSPILVESFQKQKNSVHYVVNDETMASLYKKEYQKAIFYSFENVSQAPDVDVVIFSTANMVDRNIQMLFEYLKSTSARKVFGIMSTKLIDNKTSCFWDMVGMRNLALHEIVLLPKELSNSSPKKKSIVSLTNEVQAKEIAIRKLDFDDIKKEIIEETPELIVDLETIYKYNTLNLLWKNANLDTNNVVKETEYTSAKLYRFSKEIYICYQIYSEENGVSGKAYYASTKNTSLPEVRGKSLTKRVEKGLRGTDVNDVTASLEMIAYHPKIVVAIIDDISEHYFSVGKPVSFKTLWFCLRIALLKKNSYDDVMAQKIFAVSKSLSDLYPGEATITQIRDVLCELLEEGEESKELKYLKILELILDEAINRGLLFKNIVSTLIPDAKNRVSKRQMEVRQALVKKSFEDIEEMRILEFLLPICVESSIWLAVTIRMLTGISNKEVCGLLWKDFKYNANTGVYVLVISKSINVHGKMKSHALDDLEKYRIIPLSMMAGKLINMRKDYLLKKGLTEPILEDYPIVLPKENITGMMKGHKSVFCKPSIIAQKCREAVLKAEINQHLIILPEADNELEVDINKYNGDIFRSNFKEKAHYSAGFESDELHYYLGKKKPNTFSRHYCDYTNEYIQLIMSRKLDRWTSKYFCTKDERGKDKGVDLEIYEGINDGVPCADIEICSTNMDKTSKATLEIESEYGFKVVMSSRKER